MFRGLVLLAFLAIREIGVEMPVCHRDTYSRRLSDKQRLVPVSDESSIARQEMKDLWLVCDQGFLFMKTRGSRESPEDVFRDSSAN